MPEPFRIPTPKVFVPSMKVPVPVGMAPVPVTVAVKVTELPYVDVLRDVTIAVELTADPLPVTGPS